MKEWFPIILILKDNSSMYVRNLSRALRNQTVTFQFENLIVLRNIIVYLVDYFHKNKMFFIFTPFQT